jgi:ferritin-like metal-binding protein YciE
MMSVETVDELFVDELKDIYSAEKQAVRAYPRIVKAVESEELKDALQTHLDQTKQHVERLDRVFEILEKRASGKTCEGMKGLLDEASQQIEEIEEGPVLDVALIGALQRVEHYEIAAYGTVATLAEALGQSEIKDLLGQTLQEEKETDMKLTDVAQTANSEAMSGSDEDEEEDLDEEGSDEAADEDEEDDEEEQGMTEKARVEKSRKKSAAKSGSSAKRKR